jgi:aspartate aminotransferase-like enzyme
VTQKLFTLGPVEMFEYTRERPLGPLPYFRTEAFSKINLECAARLKRLANAPGDSHVLLLACSGTGAMEAVVGGCFSENDRLAVIDGGGFGHRFAELAAHHGIPYEAVKLAFGETLGGDALAAAASASPGGGFAGLLINHHETSTGQLYDLDMASGFCSSHDLYLVCDAISSFLADGLDFSAQCIDALIVSSQKALALPPGLSAVILSDRLWEKIGREKIRPFSLYFDLTGAELDARRGQTPFTPAGGLILALRDRLERIEEEGGYGAAVTRVSALARDFRARIAGLIEKGLLGLPGHPLSNACTPLVFPGGGAKAVCEKLAGEHDVWLNPCGGELADKVLRVGHLGALAEADNEMLAGLLSKILWKA